MTIDKSWIEIRNRKDPAFRAGLDSFIERCKAVANSQGEAYCPCKRCMNRNLLIPSDIFRHIYMFGFFEYYDFWDKHGEERTLPAESIPYYFPETAGASETSNINDEMFDVVDDLRGERNTYEEENNEEDVYEFDELCEELNKELYPGTMLTMIMLVAIVAALMTDVSSRYHGGDNDDDGRSPGERPHMIASQCQASSKKKKKKKGRGENANYELEKAFKRNKNRPLPLYYQGEGDSFRIVGEYYSLYTRKLSSEVKARADFHHPAWTNVPDTVKIAIYSTLQHYFDFQSFQGSRDWAKVKQRVDKECASRYKDRKHKMKVWFDSNGGVNNLAHSRTLPYKKMDLDKWQLITDTLWSDPRRIRQAQANSQNRAKHRYESSHGSSSFAQQL
ncbi:hypothetical protein SSX86_001087 [Deinandra increscens subsp. villosa]|uniref:Transposase-associated domain-containing protein n=1 Tax=Deinandra increscens subsp. villosa TaxID=3103831 RepID=A0AAP0DR19_9ASTR